VVVPTKSQPPRRRPNADVRTREHLLKPEVERLRHAAGELGRHGHRDSTMILIAYRHGLRAAELVCLRWDQVDWENRVLHVRRKKRGTPSTQPLGRDELAALRKLEGDRTGLMFQSERGGPISTRGFHLIIARAGVEAMLGMPVHPHMLRHGCGYYLANAGHDTRSIQAWLGHNNIQHTVRYTDLAPDRFKRFWKEEGQD
jgi:site-specific recombinase XerD